MKKILIADDHWAIRSGVQQILSHEFPDMVFGEATNSTQTFAKLEESTWDLLILDIDLPGRNGFEILKFIKDKKIEIPVLVFSFFNVEQVAVRAYKAGANGYLSKVNSDKELVKAVKVLLSGKKFISEEVAEMLASHLENPESKPAAEKLSDREYQTMMLIGSGKSISEIATCLNLSVSTISTYRTRILEKMNLKSNAEIVNYAIKNKLINVD